MIILLELVSSRSDGKKKGFVIQEQHRVTPDLLVVVHEEASFGMKGLEWSVSVALWCPQASINRPRFFMELPRSLCFLNPDPASCAGSI